MLFIYIFIYSKAELLDGSYNVPALVLTDVVAYVVENPLHDIALGQQLLNHLVDSLLLHLSVVERELEIGVKVQLLGHVPCYLLEEGVDGLYTEVVVVVQQVSKCNGCIGRYLLAANGLSPASEAVLYGTRVVFRVWQPLSQPVQLAEYSELHLVCCLVGEGHGKY